MVRSVDCRWGEGWSVYREVGVWWWTWRLNDGWIKEAWKSVLRTLRIVRGRRGREKK